MEAQRDGGAHKTSVNIATGLGILANHIKTHGSERKALAAYNAGDPTSSQGLRYATEVLRRKDRYHKALT
jgi:soluble lytic murein transglycosylase-like protein